MKHFTICNFAYLHRSYNISAHSSLAAFLFESQAKLCCCPLMEAATVGLCFPDSYYEELQEHYTHMKQLFCDGLKLFGLTFTDSKVAYYVLLEVPKYSVKDDMHFCEWVQSMSA